MALDLLTIIHRHVDNSLHAYMDDQIAVCVEMVMESGPEIIEREIRLEVIEHKQTHLLVATSHNLPGLMVAARSEEQLEREVPIAIREVLEAEGSIVISVSAVPQPEHERDFQRHSMIASARLSSEKKILMNDC